jgi:hypothetical protein
LLVPLFILSLLFLAQLLSQHDKGLPLVASMLGSVTDLDSSGGINSDIFQSSSAESFLCPVVRAVLSAMMAAVEDGVSGALNVNHHHICLREGLYALGESACRHS